jgi:mono/diheme cytochrome c family protein
MLGELSCNECHEVDGTSEGHGIPNLGGRASEAWLRGLLADAGGPTYFGKKNTMPRFADKLSAVETDALVAWLRSER